MKALIYLGLVLLFFSCANNNDRADGYSEIKKDTEDSLFQDVMDQHDLAMAKMGSLAGYRKRIQKQLDSLKNVKSSRSTAVGQDLRELDGQLKQAEDGMNMWMEQFSIDSAQDDNQKRIQYLTSEKEKVTQVKDQVLAAMARADSIFKK